MLLDLALSIRMENHREGSCNPIILAGIAKT